MTGKILGFDIASNEGTISGDDGKRYKFTKEVWKDSQVPMKELKVDFDVNEQGEAHDIYTVRNVQEENSNTLMGLLAVGITFFFGFIGTFVSRLVLAKQSAGQTIAPTAIHFIVTLLVLVPVIGWIVYLGGTVYYMIKNYQLVMNGVQPAYARA